MEKEDDFSLKQLEKEFAELEMEEKALKLELTTLQSDHDRIEQELDEQLAAKETLESEEEKYWKEYSKYKRELQNAEDEYKGFEGKLKYTQTQIELKKTNVFNSTFHIWHVGAFATINGFRLGRLSSVPVEWNEINAAWGQTSLLLSCLAKAMGMESFQRYQIVPYGNYSYIKVYFLAERYFLEIL